MDAEDLADAEEAKKIQTTDAFVGLGSTSSDGVRASGLMGLFRAEGETVGKKLLKKMGWKDGQGIGPKIRRAARLELKSRGPGTEGTHLFAPENVLMVSFQRKTDRKGLGFEGESRLTVMGPPPKPNRATQSDDDDDDEDGGALLGRPRISISPATIKKPNKGGIGVGILNDTGSDDEDPYEVGPRISYNRVIVGDRKKKKVKTSVNPAFKDKPAFMPKKKSALARVGLGARKCHDGRFPLDGFIFGRYGDPSTASINSEGKYPPPRIPPDWKSSKQKAVSGGDARTPYISTADAAKSSSLDPKSRAALLGEKQLPGKSVFDFLSESSRARLAVATGKTDLPPAKGEVPAEYARTDEDRLQDLLSRVPKLDKEAAIAALSRSASGGAPYADDETKRSRYRAYLEHHAGFNASLPPKPVKMTNDEWARELQEFFNCARIFKPMTGLMASRFTTSTAASKASTGTAVNADDKDLLSKPPPKAQDPAEEAAKLGMYGPMTRSTADFYPTRLLCKRFNVKPPAHVQPDQDAAANASKQPAPTSQFDVFGNFAAAQPGVTVIEFQTTAKEAEDAQPIPNSGEGTEGKSPIPQTQQPIDSSRNPALEGTRAGEEVFKAIFGDSDDDD
jgi:G patch domain-containing protein 1